MHMDQYLVSIGLDVGRRKLKAEISLDKEKVMTAPKDVFLLPPAGNASVCRFFLSFSPLPQRGIIGTFAFEKLHLLSSNFYNRAIEEL